MDAGFAVELLQTMVFQAVALTAPMLLVGMVIGLGVSLFQAVTSIHEQTLTFVPKALGVIGILLLLLPWMLQTTIQFTTAVIEKMPQMERIVLSLYYHEELTLREIAKVVKLHESRISQLKSQAILRLRSYMQKRWPMQKGA